MVYTIFLSYFCRWLQNILVINIEIIIAKLFCVRIFSFKNFPIEQSKHYLAIYDGMSRKSNIELVHICNLVSGDWLVYRCAIWQRVLWSDHPILAAPLPRGKGNEKLYCMYTSYTSWYSYRRGGFANNLCSISCNHVYWGMRLINIELLRRQCCRSGSIGCKRVISRSGSGSCSFCNNFTYDI